MIARVRLLIIVVQEPLRAPQQERVQIVGCGPWAELAASVAPISAKPTAASTLGSKRPFSSRTSGFSFVFIRFWIFEFSVLVIPMRVLAHAHKSHFCDAFHG